MSFDEYEEEPDWTEKVQQAARKIQGIGPHVRTQTALVGKMVEDAQTNLRLEVQRVMPTHRQSDIKVVRTYAKQPSLDFFVHGKRRGT